MAKLRSGILGNIRGRVAGVVASQWKDKNTLREYVIPANPNTAAQQVQRTKMSDVVSFAKSLVGPVFNAYTDVFVKSMSGFNYFIKQNIFTFDGTPEYNLIKPTFGKLFKGAINEAIYDTNDGSLEIDWDQDLGNNGALTDKAYAAVYDNDTCLWYFPAAEVTRDDELIELTLPLGITPETLKCYLFFIQKSGTQVTMLSESVYAQAQAPA